MRALLVLFVLCASLSAATDVFAQKVTEKRLDLFIGEQTLIPAAGVDKFSEGTPGIIEIRVPDDGSDLVIVGRTEGSTTLLLIMESGDRIRYNIVVRTVRVIERDNVRLDFYFVELTRRAGSRVGIGWPGTVGGTATYSAERDFSTNTTSATATIVAEALPRIDLAQSRGWAKILKEASLIMANGELGKFETGGELNFRIGGAVATDIKEIRFGNRIEVQPRFDRTTGRLDVRVTALVSELTDESTDGLPGRTITSLETLVNLELGQSIVLAGVHSATSGRRAEGLPWLSQIPVIGYLFGAHTYSSQETENLIFIVPSVVQAVSVESRDRVAEALKAYAAFDGDLDATGTYRKGVGAPSLEVPQSAEEPTRERSTRKRRRSR